MNAQEARELSARRQAVLEPERLREAQAAADKALEWTYAEIRKAVERGETHWSCSALGAKPSPLHDAFSNTLANAYYQRTLWQQGYRVVMSRSAEALSISWD